ncbi:MAG: hypothetical protein OXC27_03760 [Caldilineaceae bacterium]|nr:hypothetical protein [Caldilineaceae bacterium]
MISSDSNDHLGEPEPALIRGWLQNVDLKQGIARLDTYMDDSVPLRFEAALGEDVIRLETKHVRVDGKGWISDEDEWIVINIEKIVPTSSEVRTVEEILNDPNPKLFDPDTVVTASEPFDVDEFLRIIYEGRGREWGKPSDR